jgi:hypothetical protein
VENELVSATGAIEILYGFPVLLVIGVENFWKGPSFVFNSSLSGHLEVQVLTLVIRPSRSLDAARCLMASQV